MAMTQNLPYPSVERILQVTTLRNEGYALAAIETLKWLDAGAPHKLDGLDGQFFFKIETFIGPYYNDDLERCGTVCCIAGAISLVKNTGTIESKENFNQYDLDREFGTKWYKDDELSKLFYPGDGRGAIDSKTPEQAAKALRGYLFTGKTVWDE